MGLSNELASEAGSFFCCCPNPMGVFNQQFEALFPCAGALGCPVCSAPPLFLLVYLCANVGPQSLPATALLRVLSTQLPISAPPADLGECFFFISVVVRLPYSSIFCQFWLFSIFKLLLSFFWLCKEVQCVYLHLHLVQKSRKDLGCLLLSTDQNQDR